MQPILHTEVIQIELYLTSEIPPSVNHYMSYRVIMKHGKPLAMSYKTQEAVKYREMFAEYVRDECKKQNWDLIPDKQQHFYVDSYFYFDKTSRDCNNYFKVMLDAITDTQLIWLDDNVVCERVQRILYDTENPRIELKIHPVDYIGVFDDAPQMETFVSKCIGCTRYNRNCSILKNAKQGKIQQEVIDGVCVARKPKR
jgi:crossover junction endodeoxyribonuclease RusA